jgi:uncharacterized membrane protein
MAAPSASAIEIGLDPPGNREFIRDLAGMLDPSAKEHIRELCDSLLTDKATPIIVITIESMAKYGGEGMRIETFATLLFDQWGIGHATLGGQDWNTGILLLVSRNDRRARIELGGGWGRREDALCRQIMDEHIVSEFKQDRFSEGIVAGVEALDKMCRKLELPTRPRPWWHYALVVGFIGLAIFTIVSLIRRGASGWAWVFWGVVFAVAEDMIGLWLAVFAAITVWLIFPRQWNDSGSWEGMPVYVGLLTMVAGVVVAFIVGVVAGSRIGWLRRLFTPRNQMLEEVSARAREIFFDKRVHHTSGATGILIYVSLFEHMAVVLGDQEVLDKLGQTFLDRLCQQLTEGLRQGDASDAIRSVIAEAGRQLSGPLPRAKGDVNELHDALVLID